MISYSSLKIIPLEKEHLEAAAGLLAKRYQEGRELNPLWVEKRRQPEDLLPLFGYQQENQVSVAAVRGGDVVGFMIGFPWDNFGVPVAWSPDWWHAAAAEGRWETYRRMYAALAKRWVAEGRIKHCTSAYAHERDVLDAFYSLGFGMHGMDAMRGMEAVPVQAEGITVRKAGPEDIGSLLELYKGLVRHLRQAPIFAYFPDFPKETLATRFEKQAKSENDAIFLAYDGRETIGAMRAGPASPEELKLPVFDEGTCAISMAITREDRRGNGVAASLLNAVLGWGRQKGHTRCSVDYESANLPGARFWLKHFAPVCYGLTRFVDGRVYEQLKKSNQL